jgi:predicted kinase
VSRRDADDLDTGPAQQHRERAHVVGVATDVRVEMHEHGVSVSVACRAVLAISLPDWLDQHTLRNVALGTMAGLALLAFLVAWLVKKVVMKLILVVLLVGAGFAIYNQREELATCAKDCDCKFFGMDVTLPEAAADACAIVNHR